MVHIRPRFSGVVAIGLCAGVLSVASGRCVQAVPVLTDLARIPNTQFSFGLGISADASTVAGYCSGGTQGTRATAWRTPTGPQNLGVVAGGTYSYSTCVNADGSVLAGFSSTPLNAPNNEVHAARWVNGSIQEIGTLPTIGRDAYGFGVSADGAVVVGYCSINTGAIRAFRWTSAGMVDISPPNDGVPRTIAIGVSANGAIIAGTRGTPGVATNAFRWTNAGGIMDLSHITAMANANGISSNGQIAVGEEDSQTGGTAVFWDALGVEHLIGSEVPYSAGAAALYAANADGSARGGQSGGAAFLVTDALGGVNLNTYLAQHGVDMTGWILQTVQGIAADGKSLTGYGKKNGVVTAYLLTNLPNPIGATRCGPADIADDAGNPLPTPGPNNGVNEGDYNAFFNSFFTQQQVGSPADIGDDAGNALPPFGAGGVNNGVNEGDYNVFLNRFFNGCG
ncbi:hypothetical protein BH11PLA1_BH11PLA1_16800 [soil metagenome]